MVLYLTIIFLSMALIAGLNIIFSVPVFNVSPWFFVFAVVVSVVFEFVFDGLIAIVVNKMPNKWFSIDKKFFNVSKREQKFYEKLGIKRWKDKVWELGGLGGFSKAKLSNPKDASYIERFLIESNKGLVTHIAIMILGFVVIFLFPLKYALILGVPVAIVNVFLNLLSSMILRYNTPKLQIVYKRLSRNNICLEWTSV